MYHAPTDDSTRENDSDVGSRVPRIPLSSILLYRRQGSLAPLLGSWPQTATAVLNVRNLREMPVEVGSVDFHEAYGLSSWMRTL